MAASSCLGQDQIDGFCSSGTLDGGEAVIRGDGRIDGGNNGGNSNGGNNNNGGNREPDAYEQDRIDAEARGGVDGPGSPGGALFPFEAECFPGTCLFDDITISDLASFRPTAPTLEMEPDGWMLIGLPANFIAKTSTHVVSGTLFDHPLDVRFTPASYAWSWGDGSTSRSSVPGASWASLGLPEFSPTATSHVYDTKGVYQISVTVWYTVEFSVDSLPWRSISGTLPGPATIVAAVAGSAKTVLVERQCTENPHGPGC
ncbi:PKD domain-containing protein [Mycetocola miduiensis]|nr:PKD domain-containing protein [Mycetocola miduiensis]